HGTGPCRCIRISASKLAARGGWSRGQEHRAADDEVDQAVPVEVGGLERSPADWFLPRPAEECRLESSVPFSEMYKEWNASEEVRPPVPIEVGSELRPTIVDRPIPIFRGESRPAVLEGPVSSIELHKKKLLIITITDSKVSISVVIEVGGNKITGTR